MPQVHDKTTVVSMAAAAFGGSSELLWLDSLMPRKQAAEPLIVHREPAWWIAAVLGAAHISILGRGIKLGPWKGTSR